MKWLQPLVRPFYGIDFFPKHIIFQIRVLGVIMVVSAMSLAASAQTIVYVKKGASGTANGTSWTDAYPELSTALTSAGSIPGNKEIWVAQGEYKPTTTLDRTASFLVSAGMFVYGGFIGNETSKVARNWKAYRTVLSGDLGKQFDIADNSNSVVTVSNANSFSGLDGLIIKGGNANGLEGAGGGLIIKNCPTVSITFSNLVFQDNRGNGSGAVFSAGGSGEGALPTFVNCEFFNNTSNTFGALLIVAPSDVASVSKLINCTFAGNSGEISSACGSIGNVEVINCTVVRNQGTPFFNGIRLKIENSIIWNNFEGNYDDNINAQAIDDAGNAVTVTNNIIQGGYGLSEDNNIDVDPFFVREPSFVGAFPRTSIIPVSSTNPKYENQLEFNGPKMSGPWPYYAFHDHTYNKTYLAGMNLQILDYNNLTNNKPTSTVFTQLGYPRTQRPDRSFHNASNSIYFAVHYNDILSVHRQTGVITLSNFAQGETGNFTRLYPNDVVVDNTNNLLYSPIFSEPTKEFYGLLELNLTTQAKRWIKTTGSPAITGGVVTWNDETYWAGFKIFLDEQANVLYFSTGNGVWWWNRTTNAAGLYNTTGGIPVATGNPQIPSNLATTVYVDNTENKVYIGTHEGLLVWNRANNTSRVYNKTNSRLIDNVINTIDKNDEKHLLYVACEDGALFIVNTQTGEEALVTRDTGSPTNPQYMDVSAASAFYDEVDKKLYVSADHPTGGTWIADYNNLVPDYGDLRLQASSPALDKGNVAALPSFVTTDVTGLPRFVDYPALAGANSLDLGAYERPFEENDEPPAPIPANLGMNYVLTYAAQVENIKDVSTLDDYATQKVQRAIQYFDGLGRPLQSIAIQGSPTKRDIITPNVYDEYGREPRKYLPFTQGDNNGLYVLNSSIVDASGNYTGIASDFYDGVIDATVESSTKPFGQTVFESSPLNRPRKDYAPGEAWALDDGNKPVSHEYLINVHDVSVTATQGEAIIVWKLNGQGIPEPATTPVTNYVEAGGYYSSNQLSIKVTVDEQGHAVREYTNKQGQVILKKVQAVDGATPPLNGVDSWACTYYIYDDLDNLVFVLQPEGYKQFRLLNQN